MVSVFAAGSAAADDPFPRKPIKIVVPFGAGGGSDTFTRIIQKAIQEENLLSVPIVIINVPGAGGSVGSRRVKNARPDGYTLLQIHEGMLTNQYSGNANFGASSFEPIAGTGQMAHVIAVPENAPYQSINDLLSKAKTDPDSIVFAVGIGAPSHFAGLMLEKETPGAKFRFTQSGGGAKRFASLAGGHSDVTTFSVAEYVEFKENGIRALAILADERSDVVPEVATAVEQQVNVISANMHFWWAPKHTPQDRINIIAEALNRAMNLPDVKSQLEQLATAPAYFSGDALKQELAIREERISQVAPRMPAPIPNLSAALLIVLALSGCTVLVESWRLGPESKPAQKSDATWTKSLLVAGLTVGYVLLLNYRLLGYVPSTLVFIVLTGLAISRRPLSMIFVAILGICLSFGLHWVFTQVLVIDLP